MNLATYYDSGPRIGIAEPPHIWDLRKVFARYLFDVERSADSEKIAELMVPTDMRLFIRLNHERVEQFEVALTTLKSKLRPSDRAGFAKSLAEVRLLSPILSPSKVLCCGSSYAEYLEELGIERSRWPQDVKLSFLKAPSSLIGHGDTVYFPRDASQADYENELAIVIGKTCSDISEEEADRYIFGYSILNDIGLRDVPEWAGGRHSPRGKAGDGFAPFGPWIVPLRYIGNSSDLRIWTTVDGEIRQDSRTSHLLWPIERIVSIISRYLTLFPGDIISTGSTTGNALTTGKYLKRGQVVTCHVENIGSLETKVDWKDATLGT